MLTIEQDESIENALAQEGGVCRVDITALSIQVVKTYNTQAVPVASRSQARHIGLVLHVW